MCCSGRWHSCPRTTSSCGTSRHMSRGHISQLGICHTRVRRIGYPTSNWCRILRSSDLRRRGCSRSSGRTERSMSIEMRICLRTGMCRCCSARTTPGCSRLMPDSCLRIATGRFRCCTFRTTQGSRSLSRTWYHKTRSGKYRTHTCCTASRIGCWLSTSMSTQRRKRRACTSCSQRSGRSLPLKCS